MHLTLRLENFRLFEDTGPIDLAPITVLCGANSSGKSSLLKSILLIKQSVVERRSRLVRDAPSQPLLLNGEWTRLGSWTDVVRGKKRDRNISIEWTAKGLFAELPRDIDARFRRTVTRNKAAEFSASLRADFRSELSKKEELSAALSKSVLRVGSATVTIEQAIKDDPDRGFTLSISGIQHILQAGSALENMTYLGYRDLAALIRKSTETFRLGLVRVEMAGPFVASIRPVYDESWTPFFERILAIVKESKMNVPGPKPQWHADLGAALDTYKASASSKSKPPIADLQSQVWLELVSSVLRDVQASYEQMRSAMAPLWKRVRYLGPLRHQPQRYYVFDDTGGIDIGVSGEFTVQVLAIEADTKVIWSRLVIDSTNEARLTDQVRTSLLDATNFWLCQMGLPTVSAGSLRQSLYELKVGALEAALPDVGFGVSQVLPVIVESLRATSGDILLLEQPEIHLHPAVQSVLADFFLARANDGVRYIIETHSEYLIKRLCRRVAERTLPNVMDATSIVFVEPDTVDTAKCTKVRLNDYGEVLNWPRGFFDSQEDLYWAKASLSRRSKNVEQAS